MKAVLLALGVVATPLQAQLYADVSTTMGDFTLELYYEDSPKTVANFVSLAEGSRNWIDPRTGIVQVGKPFYDGIIFHRVIDGFMNQVGSPQATGSDGPGYLFPDEVDNGVLHDEPYLLSSANSGVNTNGSQLFITVDVTDWLDGLHTVFGKVSSGTEVIDAINNVAVGKFFNGRFDSTRPTEDVSINSVTIRRVGAAAMAFDVTAQGLPEVEQLERVVDVSPEGLSLLLDQPTGTTLEVFRSSNLSTWGKVSRRLGPIDAPLTSFDITDGPPREFYRTSLVHWPADASFPGDHKKWVFSIDDTTRVFEFQFSDPPTMKILVEGEADLTYDVFDDWYFSDGYGGTVTVFYEVPIDGGVDSYALQVRLRGELPFGNSPEGGSEGSLFKQNAFGQYTFDSSANGRFILSQLADE